MLVETVSTLAHFVIFAFGILGFVVFLVMVRYRWQEEVLYKGLEVKRREIENQPIALPFMEGQLRTYKEMEFQPKLDILNRKRQFLKDILPFIK